MYTACGFHSKAPNEILKCNKLCPCALYSDAPILARVQAFFAELSQVLGMPGGKGEEDLDRARRPGQRANSGVTGLKYACICEEGIRGMGKELSNQR